MSDGKVSLVFGADAGNVPQVVGQINDKLKGLAAAGESAGAGVGRGLAAAGGAASTATTKFDKLGMAMGPLGGVLSRISPEAGAAASSIAGVTSSVQGLAAAGVALETLVPIVLALSTAAAVGAVAWDAYTSAAEVAAERAERRAAGLKEVTDWEVELEKAQYDLKVTTGTLTAAEEKLAFTREISAKVQKAKIGRTEEEKSALQSLASKIRYAKDQEIDYRRAKEDSDEVLAKSAKAKAAAAAKAAEEERERAAAEQAANDAAKRTTEDDLARMKRMDDHRSASGKKRLREFQEEEKAKKEAADAELARIAAEERAATEALQSRLATATSVTSSLTGLMTQLNEQQLNGIDTGTQAGRAAAKEQWEQNKAAAFAMSVVQAALGIAVASASAPPPLNIPAIIQSAVAGAAATASIVAAPPPKFHAGTARVDEVNATLKKGEAVLSTQGVSAAGREAIGRWNSGRDSGQGSPAVVMQYRHQVFNRFIRDNLRMNTPLSAAVKRGSVGFRDRV